MIYENPKYQEFNLPGVRHINSMDSHVELLAGRAVLIDLRELSEYHEGIPAIEGIRSFPLSLAAEWIFDTSEMKHIIMCAHGIRSVRVCHWLQAHGGVNVASMDGGFEQWKLLAMPVRYPK